MNDVIPRTERLPALPEGLEWKTAPEPYLCRCPAPPEEPHGQAQE